MIVTDTVLRWEDIRGIQVGMDIGNQSDRYRLTVERYSWMLEGICKERDRYRPIVGGY